VALQVGGQVVEHQLRPAHQREALGHRHGGQADRLLPEVVGPAGAEHGDAHLLGEQHPHRGELDPRPQVEVGHAVVRQHVPERQGAAGQHLEDHVLQRAGGVGVVQLDDGVELRGHDGAVALRPFRPLDLRVERQRGRHQRVDVAFGPWLRHATTSRGTGGDPVVMVGGVVEEEADDRHVQGGQEADEVRVGVLHADAVHQHDHGEAALRDDRGRVRQFRGDRVHEPELRVGVGDQDEVGHARDTPRTMREGRSPPARPHCMTMRGACRVALPPPTFSHTVRAMAR